MTGAQTPVISSLSYDEVARHNQWDVALWLDVLTLPGTSAADEFYFMTGRGTDDN